MPDNPVYFKFTPEQKDELAKIIREIIARARRNRARQAAQLGGCSVAATDDAAGLPDLDSVGVAAADQLPSDVKEPIP